jgi:hypothetical protein
MKFREARRQVLECLEENRIDHWPRSDAYRKNWLQTGRIEAEQVRDLLLRCNGRQHKVSPHDFDSGTLVHEFLPDDGATRWYIKVFVDDEKDVATFMSVHPSGE